MEVDGFLLVEGGVREVVGDRAEGVDVVVGGCGREGGVGEAVDAVSVRIEDGAELAMNPRNGPSVGLIRVVPDGGEAIGPMLGSSVRAASALMAAQPSEVWEVLCW